MKRVRVAILPILALTANAQPSVRTRFEAEFTAQEIHWGDEVLPFLEQQQAARVDAEARRFVSELGIRLADAMPGLVVPCRFVLYDDNIGLQIPGLGLLSSKTQVYALPGGILLVPLGLFSTSADEVEFSRAMARGVAHVALRHWMRTVERFSRPSPWLPYPKLLFFSRSFETEADHFAQGISDRAGYDRSGQFETIKARLADGPVKL